MQECDNCGVEDDLYWNDDYDGSLCDGCDTFAAVIRQGVLANG